MLLFGTRSSLVVEYEETCKRCELEIEAAVSFHGVPRLLDRSKSVDHQDFNPANAKSGFIPCAFVPDRRKFYFDRAVEMGLKPAEPLIDPNAVVASSAMVGAGTYINAGAVVGALCALGECVLINRSASVGHHCILEDFVSIGPGATLASNVVVGEGAVIAAGVTILPNVRIGAGSVISGGTLVRSNVPENVLVAGFPAKHRPYRKSKSSLMLDGEE